MIRDDEEIDESNINKLIIKLMDAWRTETNCPEILPFQQKLVDKIKQSLSDQQVYPSAVSAKY